MRPTRGSGFGLCVAAGLVALALLGVASARPKPAKPSLAAPVPISPATGATTDGVPAFAWKAVRKADQYEFQIAADAGFNSPVLGGGQDDFQTRNTRASLKKTVPNGTYWWRVRAVTVDGATSRWSSGKKFVKSWGAPPNLQPPQAFDYPSTPLELSWTPVRGARKYLVAIGNDSPSETTATTFTPTTTIVPGTIEPKVYRWTVIPLDAEGNRGQQAESTFTLFWPSRTAATVTDLDSADEELFDPHFSWRPVPGAARYEVEVNPSSDFAPGSKVCCSGTTIATSLSPTNLMKDNAYYWRVRPIDPSGNPGEWTVGPSFTKTFDKVPPAGAVSPTAIKHLRMRDIGSDFGTDENAAMPGYQTHVPIVRWDPVPGASSYVVEVFSAATGSCAWGNPVMVATTGVTAWTPLGAPSANPTLYKPVAGDLFSQIRPSSAGAAYGTYCVSVRARSDRVGLDEVYGDPTYLQNGDVDSTAAAGPAFTWTDYPSTSNVGCSAVSGRHYLCASDYVEPVRGRETATTPLFTWNAIAGATGYFIVIAKDQNFSNIVDEAFTRIPAYAPRRGSGAPNLTTTYSDELTKYYWEVLPSYDPSGSGTDVVPFDPTGVAAAPSNFQKRSTPPQLLDPAAKCYPDPRIDPANCVLLDQPAFRWSPAAGARTYELQVARDESFGQPLEDVITDATSYSSNTTYPEDVTLYWRVRANDENGIGLRWSQTGAFQKTLRVPDVSVGNPTSGDFIPTWMWKPVDGAVGYDVGVDLPDGSHRDLNGLRTPALTPVLMYGTGSFKWRVRAEFPKSPFGTTPGRYSSLESFTRKIGEPTGAHTEAGVDHVLFTWSPKAQVRGYYVQISSQESFGQPAEVARTDNTSYAPSLKFLPVGRFDTGHFYWRVAAVDEGNNIGDFTPPQLVKRTRRMTIVVSGLLRRGKINFEMINVRNLESGAPVVGAEVHVSGAGIRLRRLRTPAGGTLMLRLRPRRRGFVAFRAAARGYRPASANVRVR